MKMPASYNGRIQRFNLITQQYLGKIMQNNKYLMVIMYFNYNFN